MFRLLVCIMIVLFSCSSSVAQKSKDISVIGYFAGRTSALDSFPVGKLTHLIYSFCHLKGNRLSVDNSYDSLQIKKMVSFKNKFPYLKIILSLGGWGGCRDCSDVFSTGPARIEFAQSTKELLQYFNADGIDLDWEYPAISGYPGHRFVPEDKKNFTALVKTLRKILGKKYEISFAAGGFDQFIDSSIKWKKVMRYVDKVNIMSYDLVNGFSPVSGHHTPLYSTPRQKQSTDNAVRRLIAKGVSPQKLIIGAAFYGRMFIVKDTVNKGLYDPATFYRMIGYSQLFDTMSAANGFAQYWDPVAAAPYALNTQRMISLTYDDSRSIALKTKYVFQKNLGGIMFWQLMDDTFSGGLLDVIDKIRQENK
ncbi:MAG: glycoside hydrolase [Bacteroidetes bacterium]|nr:glycoside hydrolase [Bacteroidota bacterium]MBS1632081.1 glycoside hydrolase [Bacteroidota bacterium]